MITESSLKRALSAFAGLRGEARAAWAELHRASGSYVLVGTATCGRAAGALPVRDAFRETFAASGLNVPVLEVGCMGHCYAEPLAVVKRPGGEKRNWL